MKTVEVLKELKDAVKELRKPINVRSTITLTRHYNFNRWEFIDERAIRNSTKEKHIGRKGKK